MEIGNKILELRKKANLSQEQLAEKMHVTRQTISKWELNDTTPDIKQAKELSKIFNVSLDELTDNDIKDITVEKLSNTEKLAGLILKILKVLGIIFIILVILDIVALILFTTLRTTTLTEEYTSVEMHCHKDNILYTINIDTNEYFNCDNCEKEMTRELMEITDYKDLDLTVENIEKYFTKIDGSCY